jgi:hypothetical protein
MLKLFGRRYTYAQILLYGVILLLILLALWKVGFTFTHRGVSVYQDSKLHLAALAEEAVPDVKLPDVHPDTVGVACFVTSEGVPDDIQPPEQLQLLPFFRTLLPSFCRTGNRLYTYKFYVTYYTNDNLFKIKGMAFAFQVMFRQNVQSMLDCRQYSLKLDMRPVTLPEMPALAQHEAVMNAYKDKMDFIYSVTDDTKFLTDGWTEMFIKKLYNHSPIFVGVVGPTLTFDSHELNKPNQNNLLVSEFVHRTHIDIFGYHYPEAFPTLLARKWLTHAYQPDRACRINYAVVEHGRKAEHVTISPALMPMIGQAREREEYHLVKEIANSREKLIKWIQEYGQEQDMKYAGIEVYNQFN